MEIFIYLFFKQLSLTETNGDEGVARNVELSGLPVILLPLFEGMQPR